MADPINLNRARKAKAAAEARVKAAENRVRFGRTKAETSATRVEAERVARTLDGAEREDR